MTQINWFYPPTYDPAAWIERHAAGMVPSELPYGAERLRGPGREVSWRTTRPMGFRNLLRTAQAIMFPSESAPAGGGTNVDVTWEESNVPRMLAQGTSARKYAGVIWLTDAAVGARERARRHLQRCSLSRVDGLWCLSRPQVEMVRALLGRSSPPVRFVRFGIDEAFFAPTPYVGAHGVLSVGNDRDRDPLTLLDALALVHRARPTIPLRVQTDYSGRLPHGVVKLPWMTHRELREEYRRSAVVAIATRSNAHVSGMTTALEAGSSGRPVVISNTDGVSDYVVDGETGLLVTQRDPRMLADRILSLLDDPSAADQMGQRGREKAVREHTTATMMASLATLMLED